MKRILIPTILAVLLLVGAGFFTSNVPRMKATGTVRADKGVPCSLGTVAGSYGFTLTGTLVLPTGGVPVAGVGLFTITTEAEGNFTGTESRSIGGAIAQETVGPGTITVNSDCTTTLTSPVFVSGQLVRTSVFSGVFDDNAEELRAIQTSLVVPNGTSSTSVPNVITVEARKISPHSGE